MAKLKSRKEGDSNGTQTISASGTQGQDQEYDPALVSLFAHSVSQVPI